MTFGDEAKDSLLTLARDEALPAMAVANLHAEFPWRSVQNYFS